MHERGGGLRAGPRRRRRGAEADSSGGPGGGGSDSGPAAARPCSPRPRAPGPGRGAPAAASLARAPGRCEAGPGARRPSRRVYTPDGGFSPIPFSTSSIRSSSITTAQGKSASAARPRGAARMSPAPRTDAARGPGDAPRPPRPPQSNSPADSAHRRPGSHRPPLPVRERPLFLRLQPADLPVRLTSPAPELIRSLRTLGTLLTPHCGWTPSSRGVSGSPGPLPSPPRWPLEPFFPPGHPRNPFPVRTAATSEPPALPPSLGSDAPPHPKAPPWDPRTRRLSLKKQPVARVFPLSVVPSAPAGPSPSPGAGAPLPETRSVESGAPRSRERGSGEQHCSGDPPTPTPACERPAALVCGTSCGRLAGNRSPEAPDGGFLGQAATPGPGRVPLLARPIWPSLGGRLAWLPAKKELVSWRRQLKERSEPSGSAPKRPILSSL